MLNLSDIEDQLAKAGCKISSWGRAEVKELCQILTPDETIVQAVNGYYENGFALLVATDKRLLLIDRKPMFLTLDAISYAMMQEVLLNYRLLNSTIHIYTSNKVLVFNSWNHQRLRLILNYTQQKVMEVRMHQGVMSSPGAIPTDNQPAAPSIPTMPVAQTPSMVVPNQTLPSANVQNPALPYRQPFLPNNRRYLPSSE